MPTRFMESSSPPLDSTQAPDPSLLEGHIDPASLSTFQRIILTTDGTITEILEAYLSEQLQVLKQSEDVIALSEPHEALDLEAGSTVIERKIFLQGKISMRKVIYAESTLALDRLEPTFQHELLESKAPMGKLWRQNRMETYKEIISTQTEPALALAPSFGISPQDSLLSRTYLVWSHRQPIIMITEKFPFSYFRDTL